MPVLRAVTDLLIDLVTGLACDNFASPGPAGARRVWSGRTRLLDQVIVEIGKVLLQALEFFMQLDAPAGSEVA